MRSGIIRDDSHSGVYVHCLDGLILVVDLVLI